MHRRPDGDGGHGMILVYGPGSDPSIQHLVAALQAAAARYQLLDMDDLDQAALHIEVGPQGLHGVLTVDGQQIALDAIRAIYVYPQLPAYVQSSRSRLALHQQLLAWLDMVPGVVVNRPAALQANACKPWQAQRIGEAGFLVPPMLVTSDEAEAYAFLQTHGRAVFESASGVHTTVSAQDGGWLAHMQHQAPLPSQFQAYVPGVDVRVHVIGQQVFAAKARNGTIGSRQAYGSEAFVQAVATSLPITVESQCAAMSASMGLHVSGIDLRLCPDGEYVCFEVNSAPTYRDLEQQSGLRLTAALAQLLMGL
ncbi:RimK family alpha-L-glutamate ligase [Rhodoferax sp. OV413]|uniref:ATP-grasp domain-containing protein n=1 Tax=Rhodoferax sp. OV413 TaxID=1855285 RepID=UPI00159F9659|nr:hypothetical protein [Rhodoferax sp. OV413]